VSAEGRSWSGWAIPLPGGGVALDREGAAAVLFLVKHFLGGARVSGSAGPLLLELRTACEVATRETSDNGQAVRTLRDEPPPSAQRPDDLLTMKQAAQELHVTDRTARRKADAGLLGPVLYAGRTKLVLRLEVDAHRSSRSRRAS
jgi:hypothetical protein